MKLNRKEAQENHVNQRHQQKESTWKPTFCSNPNLLLLMLLWCTPIMTFMSIAKSLHVLKFPFGIVIGVYICHRSE